ncbi:uncharacterized protein METZ01_LOCUS46676 [marine metagenome]|uniref:Uncharacterized protein n=1 Tax=marine metagenome TaxID=408172 RepID=A0A381RPK0_9ZZZZ
MGYLMAILGFIVAIGILFLMMRLLDKIGKK